MRLTDSALGILRQKTGRTQEDAAKDLGVTISTISKWEGGYYPPSAEQFNALVELYQVNAEKLRAALEKDAARYLRRLNTRHRMRKVGS